MFLFINKMERPKTIFCDIDGTLWDHVGNITYQVNVESHKLLPNTLNALNRWDKLGYRIILTTGRRESMRELTEYHLKKLGIVYDQLIMGLGGGSRILINDRKPDSNKNTAYAINLVRNRGLEHYDFNSNFCNVPNISKEKKVTDNCEIQIMEYNDNYIVSKIKLYKDKMITNKHYLMKKTFCVFKGQLFITINNVITELNIGDSYTVEANTYYSSFAKDECEYFETSTVELI